MAPMGGLSRDPSRKVLRSGDVRYDSENKELKLVRALVSDKPGNNLWAVTYHDKSLGIVNFGKATGLFWIVD